MDGLTAHTQPFKGHRLLALKNCCGAQTVFNQIILTFRRCEPNCDQSKKDLRLKYKKNVIHVIFHGSLALFPVSWDVY